MVSFAELDPVVLKKYMHHLTDVSLQRHPRNLNMKMQIIEQLERVELEYAKALEMMAAYKRSLAPKPKHPLTSDIARLEELHAKLSAHPHTDKDKLSALKLRLEAAKRAMR
ncbi:MAG TPA: hypothetical protein VK158_05285 [Acidobacteriota bacterium]|nr:hypothetical protein [Acidobacteriota bacterium]